MKIPKFRKVVKFEGKLRKIKKVFIKWEELKVKNFKTIAFFLDFPDVQFSRMSSVI